MPGAELPKPQPTPKPSKSHTPPQHASPPNAERSTSAGNFKTRLAIITAQPHLKAGSDFQNEKEIKQANTLCSQEETLPPFIIRILCTTATEFVDLCASAGGMQGVVVGLDCGAQAIHL